MDLYSDDWIYFNDTYFYDYFFNYFFNYYYNYYYNYSYNYYYDYNYSYGYYYDYYYDYNYSYGYYYDYSFDHPYDDSYDYSYNFNYDYVFSEFESYIQGNSLPLVSSVIACFVISIGFPLTLLAIYALCSLVHNNHVAPVYLINLLISDAIQLCYLVILVSVPRKSRVFTSIYYIGVLASVAFMVCIALERYLAVAWPLWYRFRRSVKSSLLVSVAVWIFCGTEFLIALLTPHPTYKLILRFVFLLLPFPLLIFSLAGTLKALCGSSSVPPKEKGRIVGTLVLVLLNYTILFMPSVIQLLQKLRSCPSYDGDIPLLFLQFSPLADLLLYIFMRKGAADKLHACLCCRTTKEEEHGQVSAITGRTTTDVSSV